MNFRIPENILEDILGRTNIVELISSHIPLKRAGRNFKANCPFHHEKTPSFMVSPDRQIYHCFGCGESGNAFKFLMRYERLDFLEAVEMLAKKTGVTLPQTKSEDTKAASLYTELYRINELAAGLYQQNLNSPQFKQALDYFLKRGINEETIKLFKLGFAQNLWDNLIGHLRPKGFNLSLLEKAGLILPRDNGGFYDRFRNRVIFPIFDLKSRVLGFGARIFTSDDKSGAKYINSPETAVYTKGKNLYGLNFAKDSIRDNDYAVIVEGYFDFIVPYQEGLKNLVASQGTALTVDQVSLLKRYTNNVVMVYDADNAGQAATLRSLDIFIEQDLNVKVASLPQGLDPDLYVRKYGIASFQGLIEQAENLFDYKLKSAKSRHNAKEIEGKAKIAQEMLPTINKFKNAVLKSEYLKKLSQDLSIKEEALFEEIKKIKDVFPGSNAEPQVNRKSLNISPTEKLLLKLALEEKEYVQRIRAHLSPCDFGDERLSKIVSTLFTLDEQGKDVELNKLTNYFDDPESLSFICESTFSLDVPVQNREYVVDDCIKRIKSKKITHNKLRLEEEIKLAEKAGDETRLNELRLEFCNLFKKTG